MPPNAWVYLFHLPVSPAPQLIARVLQFVEERSGGRVLRYHMWPHDELVNPTKVKVFVPENLEEGLYDNSLYNVERERMERGHGQLSGSIV